MDNTKTGGRVRFTNGLSYSNIGPFDNRTEIESIKPDSPDFGCWLYKFVCLEAFSQHCVRVYNWELTNVLNTESLFLEHKQTWLQSSYKLSGYNEWRERSTFSGERPVNFCNGGLEFLVLLAVEWDTFLARHHVHRLLVRVVFTNVDVSLALEFTNLQQKRTCQNRFCFAS